MSVHFTSRLLRAVALSLLVQLPMMAAYVAVAHMLSPFTPLTDLAAAAALVMFAASVPISFAGWGIREMSAVFALGAIGVGTGKALAAAIIIGVGSLLAMAALSALSITSWHSGSVQTEETKPASVDYLVLLTWFLPIAAATLVLFQLYLPIASGTFLNVNLSDPIVLLGGSLFLLQAITRRQPPQWRMPNLNIAILAMTLVLAVSLVAGAMRFGYTEWAVVNKFLGWFVLLAYALTGALLVKAAPQDGLKTLLLTFAAATAAGVALEFILVTIKSSGLHLSLPVMQNEIQGFAQNRNAFAFQILMAMAAAIVVVRNQRLRILFMATFITGLWFCRSRSGWGAELVLIVAALYLRTATTREIAMAAVLAALMIVVPLLLSAAHQGHGHGYVQLPEFIPNHSTTHERVSSIRGGWEMFLQHPIFGAGLGAFKNLMIPSGDNQSLVIHSTPIWFMAETGLVGLVIFAYPALYILVSEFFRKYHDMASQLLVLTLLAFVVMAIPADMFYQRTFWLLIGAGLAAPHKSNMEVNSA